MAVPKAVAAALLEFEQLGRFSDDTREQLQKAAGVVEDQAADDEPDSSSKASGKAASTGGSK